MELVNTTRLVAEYTMTTDKHGRESLVVAAKGTFGIPADPGRVPALLDEQEPLVTCDTFTGEPGFSAPLYETDFSPPKPRCDVLLNGRCYAPGGVPQERVTVGLRVGSVSKCFTVVGRRVYRMALLYGVTASAAEPFTVMPLSYDNAYGGVDRTNEDPGQHKWYPSNHVGVGYHPRAPAQALEGRPLPNTEQTGRPVTKPGGDYAPMAFGPLGRAWQQRIRWAGTYDQAWLDTKFPFLPDDFDDRYFQCAPEDQQVDHPVGGEEVELLNLTPGGRCEFRLPTLDLVFEYFYKNGRRAKKHGVIDTVMIEPDRGHFTMTWRAALPLRRNLHELASVVAAHAPREPEPEQEPAVGPGGRRRFRSLAELVRWNRERE
jgi:hypothetical protein